MIELNGMEPTIEQVIAVARHNEQVRISGTGEGKKINRARGYVDEKACAEGRDLRSRRPASANFSDTFVPERRQLRFSAI